MPNLPRISALLTICLSACAANPSSYAEKYLSAIESGNLAKAKDLQCNINEVPPLVSISKFSVQDTGDSNADNFRYQGFSAIVDGKPLELRVFESDIFYNWGLHQTKVINALSGTSLEPQNRSEVNQRKYCVFVPYDQVDE